ncbi:MAG: YcaO-like family protein [Deltaproteobacteria bacterium]|nr:YcaO-like family protein [Deltaproteobacteria bacterium]MBW2118794.1 YcaO-like family protein [Deltaproteobacteria bacterium]MBW2345373.1 YcaO-like family protein [Deltaproteobacteria bacterium]
MKHKIVLKDAYKGYTLDLDKIVRPEETVRRFKEKLKTIDLDILEKTVRIDNGRLDIPVYFSVCGRDAEEVIGTKKQMGKGGTPHQAEASAVMELAERFSLFSFSREPANFYMEEYCNIKDRALPFESIALSVHDDSDELERAEEVFSRLPLKWARAYNLTEDKEVLIPFDWFFAVNEFNGSSAGNCMEEAILQGVCEVVERHVSAIICRNRLKSPAINLGLIEDPVCLELIKKFERAGIKLYASDFSMDTGIPTVAVLAFDPSTFPEKSEIVWTAGTTPDPHKALIRALTEAAQLAGDFNTGSNYVASGLPKFTDLAEAGFIMNPGKEVGVSGLPDLSNDNIRVEVENCVAALSETGMEVIVVDVTDPRLEIPAVYIVMPGAHFRERAMGTSVGMFAAKLITEKGEPLWAIEELKKMDRLLPDKYYTKFFLGVSHLSINEPLKALAYLDEAMKLGPKDQDIPSIYSYMGVSLKEMERYREAIETLEKAETYDNERTDVLNLMGFCYFRLKEHEKAIECFRKVLRLNPGSAIDYANIASNYRDMGNREQALHYYKFALELDPTIDFARDNLRMLEQGNKK